LFLLGFLAPRPGLEPGTYGLTVEGDVQVVTIPTLQKAISVSGIPNNLGFVIKAEQLNSFECMLSDWAAQ
jgi:hypothetical protein